MTGLDF